MRVFDDGKQPWWENLTKQEQQEYLHDHPHSHKLLNSTHDVSLLYALDHAKPLKAILEIALKKSDREKTTRAAKKYFDNSDKNELETLVRDSKQNGWDIDDDSESEELEHDDADFNDNDGDDNNHHHSLLDYSKHRAKHYIEWDKINENHNKKNKDKKSHHHADKKRKAKSLLQKLLAAIVIAAVITTIAVAAHPIVIGHIVLDLQREITNKSMLDHLWTALKIEHDPFNASYEAVMHNMGYVSDLNISNELARM